MQFPKSLKLVVANVLRSPGFERLSSPCLTNRRSQLRTKVGSQIRSKRRGKAAAVFLVINLVSSPLAAEPNYQISEIPTGEILQQSVLAARLSNDQFADLVVITVSPDNTREWHVYEQKGGRYSEPAISGTLDDDLVVLDTGVLAGRDAVLGFTKDSVYALNLYAGTRRHLVSIESIYSTPVRTIVPSLDLFRDLNDDGRDDLIVPGFNGYLVFTQTLDGNFHPPVVMVAPPLVEISFNNYPWYQPRQSYLADVTLDGLADLVFFNNRELIAYPQLASSQFSGQRIVIPNGVPVEYGSMEDMSIAMRDQDQSNSVTRALAGVADMDGDGLADLLTLSVRSEGVFKKRTTYEVHPGVRTRTGLTFADAASATIESKGFQFDALDHDFNGDGQRDMFISAVEVGIGKIVGALLTGAVKIDLDFFAMRESRFTEKPDLRRDITATFDLGSGDFFIPSVLITDTDGDGIDDLLLQDGASELRIYRGTGDERLFARGAVDIEVSMPNDPDLVQVVNLNQDNRSDFIMRHEPTAGPRKIVVMVSSAAP